MKIVSWNVAGIRACLKKGLSEFFKDVDADIFCMQEVKAMENQFDFRPDGYTMYLYPAERKGYSGTVIFSGIVYSCLSSAKISFASSIEIAKSTPFTCV